ncbi:MAG: TatD family hydrolase [Myxococcota bacterium]
MTSSPLTLFDTHAHLDAARLASDLDAVLERARDAGVAQIVTIGASRGMDSNRRALELAQTHDWIWATVGIHPHEADLATDEVIAQIEAMATDHGRVVAIGETGLDYHYDRSPREVQRSVFRRFVQMARALERPVVIHTREAEEDTVAILKEEGADQCGGVLHCFSGTRWLAEQALELGFYISFSGIVTFRSAREVQEVAQMVPDDRILVETDCPYLAPTPRRGKRNEPAYVAHTLRHVAQLRDVPAEALALQTTANAQAFYGLA